MADNRFDLELGLDFSKVTEALQQIKSQFTGTSADFQKIANRFKDSFNTMTNAIKLYGMESSQAKTATKNMERAMVELSKNGIDPASQSFQQLNSQIGPLATKMKGAGESVKKSNMQWTNLALVIQDLPYGFRGIQNNLPAVIGGFAGMTGAIYLASSVIIALFTAWDNGMIKFGNSVKLSTNFSKEAATAYASETVQLESLYRVATDSNKSMTDRIAAAKTLKEEYPGLLQSYSLEEIALGKAKTAYNELTKTIWQYALAQAATKALEEIAAQKLPLMIEKTKLLAKERKLQAIDDKQATLQGIGVYAIYNKQLDDVKQKIKDNTKQQQNLSKAASEYIPVIDSTINALDKLKGFKTKDKVVPNKKAASVGTLDDPNIKLLEAKQKYYKDDLLMFASYEQAILTAQINLAVKQAQLEGKSGGYIQTIRDTYNQLILNSQAETGRKIIEEQHKLGVEEAKEHEKVAQMILNTRFDLASGIAKINEDFANEDIKNVKAELSSTLKATRGSYQAQVDAIQLAINKLIEYKIAAKEAGSESTRFDEAIKELGFSMDGLVDPLEQMKLNIEKTFNGLATDVLAELGTQLGNVLSGGAFSMEGFMNLLADAIISIGKHLVVVSGLFAAVDKLFKNPSTWPLAIAAGVAAIAVGTAMKNNAAKSNPVKKFANGGIISGPTMGLMGEYPGAKSNPEVVAPLDKLKDMIGGGGGGTFMLRGQDLLLSVNRAQKASNLKGQNISLA